MLELTEKEWDCFNEYLKDLLNLLSEEGVMSIFDGKYSYTREEITNLHDKVCKNLGKSS